MPAEVLMLQNLQSYIDRCLCNSADASDEDIVGTLHEDTCQGTCPVLPLAPLEVRITHTWWEDSHLTKKSREKDLGTLLLLKKIIIFM